jgi:hypothetical protein
MYKACDSDQYLLLIYVFTIVLLKLVLCRLRLKALSRPNRAESSRGHHKPLLRLVTAHGSGFISQKPEAMAQAYGFGGLMDLYSTWIFPSINFNFYLLFHFEVFFFFLSFFP